MTLVYEASGTIWDDFDILRSAGIFSPPQGPWSFSETKTIPLKTPNSSTPNTIGWDDFVKGWLDTIESTLTTLWSERQIAEKVEALLLYRSELNTHLNNLINTPTSDSAAHRITEVLSVSQNFDADLRSIAKIFRKRIKERATASTPEYDTFGDVSDYGASVIRYDLTTADAIAQGSTTSLLEQVPNFIGEVLQALSFHEAGYRQFKVAEAHKRTYSWVWHEQSQFRAWLQSNDPCFWINGKAGSGKSTLMKYILQNRLLSGFLRAWAANRQLIVAKFFFWYAGQPLQKSHEGVLRSLLFQIFVQRPDMIPVIFPRLCGSILRRHNSANRELYRFSLSELTEAFTRLTLTFPDIAFFIMVDGVDEFSGDHYDFSSFLVQTANGTTMKMIVSSRPIPMCYQIFSAFPSLKLQDLTVGDIKAYIEDELLHVDLFVEMNDLEEGFANEVETSLVEKASGVFLWIVLVVKKLLIGLGNYEDRHELMARIEELPSDLEHLYDHMFGNLSSEYQREGSKLLQLVIFAKEIQQCSLPALQLFVANRDGIKVDLSNEALYYPLDQEQLRIKRIEGKLRGRSCGLLEIESKGPDGLLPEPKVEFLHRTVYDYLCNEDVSDKLKELCKLDMVEASLTILASCTYIMKRRAKFPKGLALESHLQLLFVTCLRSSLRLQQINDARYVDYLAVADTTYMSCCSSHRSYYYNAYEMLHDPPLCEDESFVTHSASMITTALFKIAKLNLPLYFAKKMTTACMSSAEKNLVLLHLLNLSRSASDAGMTLYIQNIKTMLDTGVDPLDSSNRMVDMLSPKAFEHSAKPEGFHVAARPAIPWRFWITVCKCKTEHAKITFLLVETAAKLHADFAAHLSALEKDFVHRMRHWRKTCQDVETCIMLDNVLTKLEQGQKKRQYSNNGDTGARPKPFSP